jgi:Flp pilus assembly protein TadG
MSANAKPARPKMSIRRLPGDRRGNAAVELALVLPIVVALLSGVIDFGMMVRATNALQTMARAGAAYAAKYPADSAGIAQAATGAAALDPTTLSVTATQFCECSGAAVACGSACPAGGAMSVHVSVAVAQPYHPLTPFADAVLPSTLTAQATMRTQ